MIFKQRLARTIMLLLLFVGAGIWYVNSQGGLANIARLAPVLDSATPQTQFGYTLVAVKRQESYKYGSVAYLLIRPPSLTKFANTYSVNSEQDGSYEYTDYEHPIGAALLAKATGQTSNGDSLPLQWTVVGDLTNPKYIRVEIPGNYPSNCRYIDVTLVTNKGYLPHWRISRLPTMQQMIPENPVVINSITKNGVTITARAWQNQHNIDVQLRPILASKHQWDLTVVDQCSEWQTFVKPTIQATERVSLADYNGKVFEMSLFPTPYRSASRYVKLDCVLRQYETYDETVIFHNLTATPEENAHGQKSATYFYLSVPQAQSVTTPSGVHVTLPLQGKGQHGYANSQGLNFILFLEPSNTTNLLINSPLVKTYDKPVTIGIQVMPPLRLEGWTNNSGAQQNFSAESSQILPNGKLAPLPNQFKDFKVIVRQRVDIQTIPITFTIPVSDMLPRI